MFVVRTVKHSFLSRAGTLTYVAFVLAQMASTLIGIFGFNGYEEPRDAVEDCEVSRDRCAGCQAVRASCPWGQGGRAGPCRGPMRCSIT